MIQSSPRYYQQIDLITETLQKELQTKANREEPVSSGSEEGPLIGTLVAYGEYWDYL